MCRLMRSDRGQVMWQEEQKKSADRQGEGGELKIEETKIGQR